MHKQVIYTIMKRRKTLVCVALAILCFVAILQTDMSPDLYFINLNPEQNISCHYVESRDALPLIDEKFAPPARSMFFHETSCKGVINSRQACAIESAAITHPDWQINVLFAAPVTEEALNTGNLALIKNLKNVNLYRVHILKYVKGTPLESLVSGGALRRSRWPISHTSDILRYLSLYKYGGVYLDLDVVVAKNFETLEKNWAARESETSVAAGALSFSRDPIGRIYAEAAIRDIKSKYRGDVWGQNGPGVITRILKDMCSTQSPPAMSVATCNGFEVYGPQFFYPVVWWRGQEYFQPGEIDMNSAYVYHVWNQVTKQMKVAKDSPYEKLAKKYCPSTYKMYGDEFGV